jgi:pyruvate dehydrogenase E2 component (dihydrolipoamide acetyltransferase)
MAEFVMPKLGADMESGVLIAWRKQPGDAIARGDIMAEVDTAKGVIEVESFASGKLDKLLGQPGERYPVGAVLAIIRENGVAAGVTAEAPPPARPVPAEQAVTAAMTAAREKTTADLARLRISPAARRLARELGVDPTTVTGSGRGGAIMSEDIERAAAARQGPAPPHGPVPPAPAGAPAATAAERSAAMRQAIAAAMSRSKREIPHYYLSTTIDLHRAMTWLEQENAKRPIAGRLLYGALLLKAVALALRETPELNSLWQGDHAEQKPSIHVGVAISLRQGGLVAPALHDTDQLSLDELMKNLLDLVSRARAGKLRGSELADPTITVTSLGEQGVETVFGVIYPPQTALVGFGKVVDRPWAVDGAIAVRPVVTATLSADHRVSDGHRGAIFLAAVDRLLQEPEKL